MNNLSEIEKKILMELQYGFPVHSSPFSEISERLGMDAGELIDFLVNLNKRKILKRIGFYVNYRSEGKTAALVAFAAGEKWKQLTEIINKNNQVTHNYLRDHPNYNVWIVIKDESRKNIIDYTKKIADKMGIRDWLVLFGKKTIKLSVKFDLYKGISYAGKHSMINPNPPKPDNIGVPSTFVRKLRSLPLKSQPYESIMKEYGFSQKQLDILLEKLLNTGIIGDPGAALDGHKIGFIHNAMVTVKIREEEDCNRISFFPYATHVVLREPYPRDKWDKNCYFMVHSIDRALLESEVHAYIKNLGFDDFELIYSLKDLKPGVIR